MVDIHRAARVQEKELRTQLDRQEVLEALRKGNLDRVFKSNFRIEDFKEFFTDQWRAYCERILQDGEVKAQEGTFRAPAGHEFPVQHRELALPREEMAFFNDQMGRSLERLQLKGMEVSKGIGTEEEKGTAAEGLSPEEMERMTPEELAALGEGTLEDFQQFMDETWMQILDAQMMQDYRSKMAEIQQEVRRIVALVKQGVLGPEFALIALAKVNATKNGVLLTGLGKKAFHVNEAINRVADDLKKGGAWDPGAMQTAQAKTRDGAFQLNLLVTDMQKIMQDSASVLEQVHGMMGEMNRTRREIITKVAAH